jgi:hypothetical protein
VLFEAIPILTAFATAAAGAEGVRQAVQGLLAKRAAKKVLARRIKSDERLRYFIHRFSEGRPADAEVEAVGEVINEYLKGEVTDAELRRVNQGLHQSNKSAERRYIEDLISTSDVVAGSPR